MAGALSLGDAAYRVLLVVHVLAATTGAAGVVAAGVMTATGASGRAAADVLRRGGVGGLGVATAVGAVMVAVGPWSFGDGWVSGALSLLALAGVGGAVLVLPILDDLDRAGDGLGRSGADRHHARSAGVTSTATDAGDAALRRRATVAVAALWPAVAGVLALMVLRPG